jgi:hypothetical protein
MYKVPQFDFTTMNYVSGLDYENTAYGTTSQWEWTGPSQPVQHIALAVMGLGDMLQISPPSPNASWSHKFWGPALRCDDVAGAKRDSIWTNIWNSYNGTSESYVYLSWAPWSYVDGWKYWTNFSKSNIDPDLPFLFRSDTGPVHVGPPPAYLSTNGPASMFVAVLPASENLQIYQLPPTEFSWTDPGGCNYRMVKSIHEPLAGCLAGEPRFTPSMVYEDATLLRCDLFNTSYLIDFKYLNGAQHVTVRQDMTDNAQIVHGSNYFVGPDPPSYSGFSALANCSTFQTDRNFNRKGTPCTFEAGAVRLLSYQGIMSAFNQMVLGAVTHKQFSFGFNTAITRTILAQTEELGFLRNMRIRGFGPELQPLVSNSSAWAYQGLVNPHLPNSRGQLKSILEEQFQNYTVSLLAEPYLQ